MKNLGITFLASDSYQYEIPLKLINKTKIFNVIALTCEKIFNVHFILFCYLDTLPKLHVHFMAIVAKYRAIITL